MIIGVTADTHIPTRAKGLPEKLVEQFKKVDLILHAGDFVQKDVLEIFKAMARVEAVYGNMDEPALKRRLPDKKIVEIEGIKIGLVHGYNIPWDFVSKVPRNFGKEKLDCLVFGHTHIPRNERIGGILYFNPGSPTDTIFSTSNTFGILEVEGGYIKGKIIKI